MKTTKKIKTFLPVKYNDEIYYNDNDINRLTLSKATRARNNNNSSLYSNIFDTPYYITYKLKDLEEKITFYYSPRASLVVLVFEKSQRSKVFIENNETLENARSLEDVKKIIYKEWIIQKTKLLEEAEKELNAQSYYTAFIDIKDEELENKYDKTHYRNLSKVYHVKKKAYKNTIKSYNNYNKSLAYNKISYRRSKKR
jgi:hypothetical protein